jgi:hypothetical protein
LFDKFGFADEMEVGSFGDDVPVFIGRHGVAGSTFAAHRIWPARKNKLVPCPSLSRSSVTISSIMSSSCPNPPPPFTPPPLFPHLFSILVLINLQTLVALSNPGFLPSFAYFRDEILPGGWTTVKGSYVFLVVAHVSEAIWFWRWLAERGVSVEDRVSAMILGWLPLLADCRKDGWSRDWRMDQKALSHRHAR